MPRHYHGTTHGSPWHPHGIPWRDIGFHDPQWGVPWHTMGVTMTTPAATATALHGNPTAFHGNPHRSPMFTAARIRVRDRLPCTWYAVGVRGRCRGLPWTAPWYAVEGFAAGGASAMPRHFAKKNNNVHPKTLQYIAFSWHAGKGFHGMPWGMSWHAMGGTMVTPATTATTPDGDPMACRGNLHGTPMSSAPRVRVRNPCTWYAVKVREQLRGMPRKVFAAGGATAMLQHVAIEDNIVHPLLRAWKPQGDTLDV